jgi:sec-independent protein translocase protein TatC
LIRQWRLAVVVILVASALITPGDYGVTMLLIAIPIAGLYLASIVAALFIDRRRRRREAPPVS